MAVRGVDAQHVDAGAHQRRRALLALGPHADRGADAQPAHLVLARMGMARRLVHVLDRDQAAQAMALVDQRQLFDPMGLEDFLGLLEADAGMGGDDLGRHHFAHRLVQALLEAQVAVGQDTDQAAVGDHRQARDAVALHGRERVGDTSVRDGP